MQFIKAMDRQEVYVNNYAAKIQALVKTPRRKKSKCIQNLPDALPSK